MAHHVDEQITVYVMAYKTIGISIGLKEKVAETIYETNLLFLHKSYCQYNNENPTD